MSYDAWGTSWGNPSAWGTSWVHSSQVVVIDTHDGEGERSRKKREKDERRRDFLQHAFDVQDGTYREAVEIVRQFASSTPDRIEIDWNGLRADLRALGRIAELQREHEKSLQSQDDDETFFMVLQ